jgi:hypothetical protein
MFQLASLLQLQLQADVTGQSNFIHIIFVMKKDWTAYLSKKCSKYSH